jgi:hypothetical protein
MKEWMKQHVTLGTDGQIDYLNIQDEGPLLEMDSRQLLADCIRLQQDRDSWMASSAGYGSDMVDARCERDEARSIARYWFWEEIAETYGGVDEILATYPWLKRGIDGYDN